MKETGKMEILGLKELQSQEEREKQKQSIAIAYEEEGADMGEAQELLINLIISIGGIRKEVYGYLLTPRFADGQAVTSAGRLLCYAAPAEWLQLAVEALGRPSGTMYVNEITEAYQDGIPFAKVKDFLEKSETVFEMCQYRLCFSENQRAKKEEQKLSANMTGSDRSEPSVNVTGSNREKMMEGIKEAVVDAIRTVLESFEENNELGRNDNRTEDEKTVRKEVAVNAPEDEAEELSDSVTESEEMEPPVNVTGSKETEPPDSVTGSEAHETGRPETPDGTEILNGGMLVVDLKKEQENSRQRISFFRILLNRHIKKEFAKMKPESQVGKIFEIMVDKKYGKEQILSIRRLMNGGMSNEFIFALLEKDLSGEELANMCQALLQGEATGEEGTERSDASAKETGENERWQDMDMSFDMQEEYV